MFEAAVAKVTNSLFPIYRAVPVQGTPLVNYAVAGTGFFLDAWGTFATVAHVFDSAPPGTQFEFRGRSPDHFQNPLLKITEVARDDANDIFIGRVDAQVTHGLDLADSAVPLGAMVCVAGYPLAQLGLTPDGVLNVGQVRRYFQNAMVVDRAAAVVDGRNHHGFLMTAFSMFGASGGPVVTTDGAVVGMQASVVKRVSQGPNGHNITVENAVAIGVEHISALLARISDREKSGQGRAA